MQNQIPKNWQKVKLGDIAVVNMGQSPRSEFYNFQGEGLPFYQGVTDFGEKYPSATMYCSDPIKRAESGTVLFSVRAPVGEVNIVNEESCIGRGVASISMKNENNAFLYPLLKSKSQYFKAVSGGTTYESINKDQIKNMELEVPNDPEDQKQIASILSTFDDLIENNNKQIKSLEEMAQAIFKEWFVHFRFPGYEEAKMVDSPLGKIPEGWNRQPIGKILNYHIGGGWGSEEVTEQFQIYAYVIRGTDIPTARHGSIEKIPLRYHKKTNFNSRKLIDKDIVFEVSGGSKDQPVGRALFINQTLLNQFKQDVICASFCKLLRVDKNILPSEILYLHLIEIYKSGKIYQYQVQSTGITNFKFESFINKEIILIPDKEIKNQFSEIIEPLFNQVQMLGTMNTSLRQARDLLLPKLMRGEVTV